MDSKSDLVLMAVIGAPHGVKGELRAKAHSDDPMALNAYGPLRDESGETFEILSIRPAKNVVVLRLAGVTTREAAEALKGRSLYIERERLPDDELEDDEFFQTDLIGLAVHDAQGKGYGNVQAVYNFGGGDILELSLDGKRTVMIPFNETAVTQIDLTVGTVTVDPLAAGLDDITQGPGSRRRRPPRKAGARGGAGS